MNEDAPSNEPLTPAWHWDAGGYAAHSAVQQNWARELIARLHLQGHERVLDVGCGDGKVTAEIARAVPRGAVTGTDISPEMIAFAQETFPPASFPNLNFLVADARRLYELLPARGTFDLVFSNAALHWVDDHRSFLRGAAFVLRPGGRLAASCGGRGNARDVFRAMVPEIKLRQWREYFRRMPRPYFFHRPADYESWLPRKGFRPLRVELIPKDSYYEGAEGFAAWLRLTWLPYVRRVPPEQREQFIAGVTRRYLANHPPDAAGRVAVRMVRLEIEAEKI